MQILQDEILEPVRLSRVNHLLGMNAKIFNPQKERALYNIALLVKANGDASQRYDKIHRLPFGEYVPLRDILPFLNHFAPYVYDHSIRAGEKYTLRVKVTDANSTQPKKDLKDLGVLVFLAPGIWQQRELATETGDGVYQISFVPPQQGVYYVFFQSPSLGVLYNQLPPLNIQATK